MEKIAPKNRVFYQEFIAVSGTFASLYKEGLIIDKSRLWNLNGVLRQAQDKLARNDQSELQKPVK